MMHCKSNVAPRLVDFSVSGLISALLPFLKRNSKPATRLITLLISFLITAVILPCVLISMMFTSSAASTSFHTQTSVHGISSKKKTDDTVQTGTTSEKSGKDKKGPCDSGYGKLRLEISNDWRNSSDASDALFNRVEYTLFRDKECSAPAVAKDGDEAILGVDTYGCSETISLEAGTYYLKETMHPSGCAGDLVIHALDILRQKTTVYRSDTSTKRCSSVKACSRLNNI